MSTPSGPRPPHGEPPLEPIRVLRPRRTDALAELMREYHEETRRATGGPAAGDYESVTLPRSPAGPRAPSRPPAPSEALTQELPPLAPAHGGGRAAPQGAGPRRAAVAVAV
ncbi:peptidoglycan-binding protein, partial [Streptomyces sp. NPDC029554]